jgi:hypothetical protein
MWPVQAAWISCASVASQGHFMGKHRVHNPHAGSSGFQQSGQQQLCLLPPYLQPTQMWRRLELVHALNISHSSLNPTSVWEKHFVAWMYMDVYCLLLSTLRSRYVKIADSILFFSAQGVRSVSLARLGSEQAQGKWCWSIRWGMLP